MAYRNGFLLILCFCFFSLTDLYWLDSSDLVLGGLTLGMSHPPGQFLYSIGLSLLELIPLGSIYFRAHLFSWLAYVALAWVLKLFWDRTLGGDRSLMRQGVFFVTFLAALLTAPFFNQLLRVEVYPLALALSTLSAYCFLSKDKPNDREPLAFLTAGMVLWVHPVFFIALLMPMLLVARNKKNALWIAPWLTLYAYGMLRFEIEGVWIFGLNGTDFNAYTDYFRGKMYPAYRHFSVLSVLGNLFAISKKLFFDVPVWLILSGGAVYAAVKNKDRTGLFLGGMACTMLVLLAAQGNFWVNNPDAEGYLLLVYAALIILGFHFVGVAFSQRSKKLKVWLAVAFGIQCAWSVFNYMPWVGDASARIHLSFLDTQLGDRSVAILASFSTYTMLRLAQLAEKRAPYRNYLFRGEPRHQNQIGRTLSNPNTCELPHAECPYSKSLAWAWEARFVFDPSHQQPVLSPTDQQLLPQLQPTAWFFMSPGPLPRSVFSPSEDLATHVRHVFQNFPSGRPFFEDTLLNGVMIHQLFCKQAQLAVCSESLEKLLHEELNMRQTGK